jgi:hypothetical protein
LCGMMPPIGCVVCHTSRGLLGPWAVGGASGELELCHAVHSCHCARGGGRGPPHPPTHPPTHTTQPHSLGALGLDAQCCREVAEGVLHSGTKSVLDAGRAGPSVCCPVVAAGAVLAGCVACALLVVDAAIAAGQVGWLQGLDALHTCMGADRVAVGTQPEGVFKHNRSYTGKPH